MCLNVLKGSKKPKTATEDITVYKRLYRVRGRTYLSPFQDYKYVSGRLYTSELGTVQVRKYHPESVRAKILRNKSKTQISVGDIEKGIHAYTSRETAEFKAWDWASEVVVECTIPKGAQYHLGTGNEIVSNQLLIGKKL